MRLIESLSLNTCGTCKRKYAAVVGMRNDRTSWEHDAGISRALIIFVIHADSAGRWTSHNDQSNCTPQSALMLLK